MGLIIRGISSLIEYDALPLRFRSILCWIHRLYTQFLRRHWPQANACEFFSLFDWPILRKYIFNVNKIDRKCCRYERRRNLDFNLSTLWAQQLPKIGIMQRSTNNLKTRQSIFCSASLMKYALIIMKWLRKLRARESAKRVLRESWRPA